MARRLLSVSEGHIWGMMLHHRLNCKSHCDEVRAKAFTALRELTPLLRSSLPIKTKILVYSAYIRPILAYAEVVQNKALRMIGDYDYDTRVMQLHQDNDISTLKNYIKQQTRKFYSKTATNTTNSLHTWVSMIHSTHSLNQGHTVERSCANSRMVNPVNTKSLN